MTLSPEEPIRVLHVDDDPDFLEMAATFLEREDDRFVVETATSAGDGRDRLADSDIDCVVSDYQMPGTNGLEFLDDVRDAHPDLPFILFTGKGSEEIASEAISAGVTDYLQKETGTDQYVILGNRIANAVKKTRVQHQRQRHLRAIETAREGISLIDENGHFTYVNQAYAELYGYAPDELVGEHWDVLYPDDEAERIRSSILPEFEANGRWRGETSGIRTDGEPIVEDHSLARTEDGTVVSIVRDVTDQRARAEELAFFEQLVDRAGVGMAVYGATGRFEYVNEQFTSLLNSEQETLVGTPIWDVRADIEAARFDDYWHSFERGETRTVEVELERTDGTPVPVEITTRHHRINGTSYHVETARDVSERKHREQQREENRRYRSHLYERLADPDLGFEETQRELLELGCDYLDLADGKLVRTDTETGSHESVRVAHDRSLEGTEVDLAGTYCRHVVSDGVRLAVSHPGASELTDDPAYEAYPHECYIGARVAVDGETYGTVCFYDTEPREPFTQAEETFVELVAHAMSYELKRQRHDAELQQYKTMVNTAGDMVYTLDEEGRFEFVNDTAERFTGYDREELLGEHVQLIVEEEDIEAGRDLIRSLLREGGAGHRSDAIEWTLHRADGDTVPCESHIALLYADGEWRGTVGVVRDMTDRTDRERELEMYRAAVEAARDGITVLDADGRYQMVNDVFAEVVGLPKEEIIGKDPTFLLDHGVIDESAVETGFEKILECLDSDTDQIIFETRIQSPTFGEEVVEHNLALVSADADADASETLESVGSDIASRVPPGVDAAAIEGAVVTHRKVTERKKREQALRARERELQRHNERLEEFASVVSHDLRNPLNVAMGHLDLLRENCDDGVEPVERALERMESIIDDLLKLARHGDSLQDLAVVESARVVGDAWESVETDQAVLSADWEAHIEADGGRLQQLFENLFRNAIEHAGEDVTVSVGPMADGSGFYVADDGSGIPDDERDQVFDAGYSTSETGTGLGLNIVAEIAEAHGWDVSVTDGTRGGARFEFTGIDAAERPDSGRTE